MNLKSLARASRLAAIGAILFGSASCVKINEQLGENLIPTDQKWEVFEIEPMELTDIRMQMSDSLSGYSTSRFVFGSVRDSRFGTSIRSASFTLVPLYDTLDFGEDTKIRQFHFSAVCDTLSVMNRQQLRMLQNVYVSELRKPLDSTVLYTGSFMSPEKRAEYLDTDNIITTGIPVYDGGDSLSFDFSREFTERFIERLRTADLDSMDLFIQKFPGIYITTDAPVGDGGRINLFNIDIDDSQGYLAGNYAELKITARYDHSEEPIDTSFAFFFGPAEFLDEDSSDYPTQFAFNASEHETYDIYKKGVRATDKIYIEGGSGVKPVIKAREIKQLVEDQLVANGIVDKNEVVINKASLILPYNVDGNYELLDNYPMILSPTVRLRSSEGGYVSYAGLTDSSISTENQGDINRSLSLYSPDISYHVQEILSLDESAEDYEEQLEAHDIWFLIMYEEVVKSESNSSYNDLYNSLLYSSYYNNLYGYNGYGGYGGYGGYYGGYGGYGYDSYGYGSNYYNYYMMAMYASAMNSSSSSSSSVELDKDRYYCGILNGPEAEGAKPQLKITFSVPQTAEK